MTLPPDLYILILFIVDLSRILDPAGGLGRSKQSIALIVFSTQEIENNGRLKRHVPFNNSTQVALRMFQY